MKTLNIIFYITLLSLLTLSCEREFDGPPLTPPDYSGKPTITIAGLKEHYKDATTSPTRIEFDFVVNAYITGNDESGNIYKQLYIEDETGAIALGIDQNSIYAYMRAGQEVFLELYGLSILTYGDELQIGYTGTNANRIPWEVFLEHVHFQDYPNPANVTPALLTINELNDSHVNKLVRFDNIYFTNANGQTKFTADDNTTEEAIKDANGFSLNVRTSSYADFANDTLPTGYGSIVGILGRYNGSWQLLLRTKADLIDFGSPAPGDNGGGNGSSGVNLFYETFGTGYYPSGSRPTIGEFNDFDMKAPVEYSDPTVNADIRSMSGDNGAHVWFPAGKEASLIISGINTSGEENLSFSFQLAANLYNPGEEINLNVVTVKVNGTTVTIPGTPVSNANGDNSRFYTFEFENVIPAMNNLTIEFHSSATTNTVGLRLDNIRIYREGSGTIDL